MCMQPVGGLEDFFKYGLLRTFAFSGIQLGVQAYNTQTDFKKEIYNSPSTRYLGNPQKYKAYDPELFESFKALLRKQSEKDSFLENVSKSHVFPSDTLFFTESLSFQDMPLTYREQHRLGWFAYGLAQLQNCDLVFLDPLHGLEIKSISPYRNIIGPYYATFQEVKLVLSRQQSVMIHQRVARRSVEGLVAESIERIKSVTDYQGPIYHIHFRAGSSRLFFILPAQRHNLLVKKALEAYQASPWKHLLVLGEG